MITHLFVYGTLRPGQERWPFLAPFVTDDGYDDAAVGALYDTGNGYPAARFDHAGTIHGRVYPLHLDRLDEARAALGDAARNPVAAGDWVAAHVLCTIDLRAGATQDLLERLRRFGTACPDSRQQRYFRSTLAVAELANCLMRDG